MECIRSIVGAKLRLVANNPMRIAGIQGVYGDPCGVEITPVSLTAALSIPPDSATTGPEILLLDAGSVGPLFEVLAKFKDIAPEIKVVVIGRDADESYIECVIAAGGKGWLAADALADEFRVALENVREGSIWAPRRVLSRIVESRLGNRSSLIEMPIGLLFTPREKQIIALLLSGRGNREIGEHLGIGPVTVKAHLGRIMRKAGVGNRVELTVFALGRMANEDAMTGEARVQGLNRSRPVTDPRNKPPVQAGSGSTV